MFSFGGSTSKTKSTSNSLDYGANVSQSFSDSLSRAISGGQSTSGQNIAFEDLYAQMYGGATGAAGRAAEQVPLLQGQAASLFSSGNQFLESLQGGSAQDYLQGRMTGDNPLVDQQIGALGDDLSRFFGEKLNPQITSNHVAGGTLGGGRQGVAQGMAMDSVGREFQQGALGLRAADMQQRDAAAGQLGMLQQQGAATGLGSLDDMFGIAQGGATAEMLPHQMLSQILGGPTALTSAQSTQFSESEAVARAISEAMGFSFGESNSKSKGSSKSFDVGGIPI